MVLYSSRLLQHRIILQAVTFYDLENYMPSGIFARQHNEVLEISHRLQSSVIPATSNTQWHLRPASRFLQVIRPTDSEEDRVLSDKNSALPTKLARVEVIGRRRGYINNQHVEPEATAVHCIASVIENFACVAGVGVYISRVEEGSVAERAGLRPGDSILEVNGTPFTAISHEEALKASHRRTDKPRPMRIRLELTVICLTKGRSRHTLNYKPVAIFFHKGAPVWQPVFFQKGEANSLFSFILAVLVEHRHLSKSRGKSREVEKSGIERNREVPDAKLKLPKAASSHKLKLPGLGDLIVLLSLQRLNVSMDISQITVIPLRVKLPEPFCSKYSHRDRSASCGRVNEGGQGRINEGRRGSGTHSCLRTLSGRSICVASLGLFGDPRADLGHSYYVAS
ncbi:Deafness, autosomal recessive [Homalodisca vitripennis]|nr:Deafness, autosomal recessive [Homalodisca vitripennis]